MAEQEGKRIDNPFDWLPPEKRQWRFGPPLAPEKPDNRKPAFYIDSIENGFERSVFFVNNTPEILDYVRSSSGGFETLDDDVMPINGSGYSYENVLPNEAVQVECYHRVYDSDSILSLNFEVSSRQWGIQRFSAAAKGGPERGVLLWDNGEPGNMRW